MDLRQKKTRFQRLWIWFCTPFANFWMKYFVLPREERMKKRILKSPRLMTWVSNISIALVNRGTYDPLIKMKQEAKKAQKKKNNRRKRAPLRVVKK